MKKRQEISIHLSVLLEFKTIGLNLFRNINCLKIIDFNVHGSRGVMLGGAQRAERPLLMPKYNQFLFLLLFLRTLCARAPLLFLSLHHCTEAMNKTIDF